MMVICCMEFVCNDVCIGGYDFVDFFLLFVWLRFMMLFCVRFVICLVDNFKCCFRID